MSRGRARGRVWRWGLRAFCSPPSRSFEEGPEALGRQGKGRASGCSPPEARPSALEEETSRGAPERAAAGVPLRESLAVFRWRTPADREIAVAGREFYHPAAREAREIRFRGPPRPGRFERASRWSVERRPATPTSTPIPGVGASLPCGSPGAKGTKTGKRKRGDRFSGFGKVHISCDFQFRGQNSLHKFLSPFFDFAD